VFLVDERDSTGLGFPRDLSAAEFKRIYLVDLDDAQDVSDVGPGDGRTDAQRKTFLQSKAAKKYLFLNVLEKLQTALGLAATEVPAKLEGIALGDDVVVGDATLHTVYVANDNDFDPSADNPNQFFVFAFSDDDLANAKASDNSTLGRVKAAFEPQIVQNK
jgi:Esterase-like activity of phytase